ncbi:hypothetical protein PITC_070930 [Penicillium italicum]|uniref:Ankyrin repeat-containing domain-containing protein n=1 Tax=Penicillium italicum TaxID=40296 RepID=A0A0A2KND9_PENIT|nr:hypothetical protein PITC_070930 [Penicillium italicum]
MDLLNAVWNDPGKKQWCHLSLCLAVMKRHIPIIQLLLIGSYDPNIMYRSGEVLLYHVTPALATTTTMEILRLLIDAGADSVNQELGYTFSLALGTANKPFIN